MLVATGVGTRDTIRCRAAKINTDKPDIPSRASFLSFGRGGNDELRSYVGAFG